MLFKEIWIVAASGSGMIVSQGSILLGNLLSGVSLAKDDVQTRSKPSDATVMVPEVEDTDADFADDFTDKTKMGSGWKQKVTSKTGKTYELYKPHNFLDFNLTFTPTDQELSKISPNNIKVRLFKESVWTSEGLKEDQYTDVPRDKIKTLFDGTNDNKVKKLLLRLSTRIKWIKLLDDQEAFYPLFYFPRGVNYLIFDGRIKYFKSFISLKKFIDSKLESCATTECIINENELKMIAQDKKSFFDS